MTPCNYYLVAANIQGCLAQRPTLRQCLAAWAQFAWSSVNDLTLWWTFWPATTLVLGSHVVTSHYNFLCLDRHGGNTPAKHWRNMVVISKKVEQQLYIFKFISRTVGKLAGRREDLLLSLILFLAQTFC